jgi:hypothetical protein
MIVGQNNFKGRSLYSGIYKLQLIVNEQQKKTGIGLDRSLNIYKDSFKIISIAFTSSPIAIVTPTKPNSLVTTNIALSSDGRSFLVIKKNPLKRWDGVHFSIKCPWFSALKQ